jgi:hypothetical protein
MVCFSHSAQERIELLTVLTGNQSFGPFFVANLREISRA